MSNHAIIYPPAVVPEGSTWLQQGKHWLINAVGLEKDALHVYFALTILFGTAWLFRWSLRSWKPSAIVLAVAILGEIGDIHDGLLTRVPLEVSLPDSVHDVINTMFWPLAILLLAHVSPLFGERTATTQTDDQETI